MKQDSFCGISFHYNWDVILLKDLCCHINLKLLRKDVDWKKLQKFEFWKTKKGLTLIRSSRKHKIYLNLWAKLPKNPKFWRKGFHADIFVAYFFFQLTCSLNQEDIIKNAGTRQSLEILVVQEMWTEMFGIPPGIRSWG